MTDRKQSPRAFKAALFVAWLALSSTHVALAEPEEGHVEPEAPVASTEIGFFVQSGAAVTSDGEPRFALLQLGVQHYVFRLSLAIDHDLFLIADTQQGRLANDALHVLQVGPSLSLSPRFGLSQRLELVVAIRGAIQAGTGRLALAVNGDRHTDADVLTALTELQIGVEYLRRASGCATPAFGAHLTVGFTDDLKSRYITASGSERFELEAHAYVGIAMHAAFYLFEEAFKAQPQCTRRAPAPSP